MPSIERMLGRDIIDYSPETGITDTSNKVIYRVGYTDWDDFEENGNIEERLSSFFEDPNVEKLDAFIMGAWTLEDDMAEPYVEQIVSNRDKLPNLKSLFFGDIGMEEQEISWIENTDVGPLLTAFPDLTYFRVRGGMGLAIDVDGHEKLETLIVETGGLGSDVTEKIASMNLPALVDLELWFGSSDYGFDGGVDSMKPLIIGKPYPENSYPFPKLKRLALRNCEIADDVAEAFADAKVLEQIETLDFSMGTMTERGAQALAENPAIANLKTLVLDSNFIHDKDLITKLEVLGPNVTVRGQKDGSSYGLYVDVSE